MALTPLSAFYGITVSGLTAAPLSGFTLATPFTCALSAQPGVTQAAITTDYNLIWWFGDGTSSTDFNPTHIYSWPGVYEVKLGVFNNDTTPIVRQTYSVTVTANNFIQDNLVWDYSTWPDLSGTQYKSGGCFHGYQSCYSGTVDRGPIPLTVNYQTSILDNSTLNFSFYSDNSLSQPYTEIPTSQISTLRPSWRFTSASATNLADETVLTKYNPVSSVPVIIDSQGHLSSTGTLVGLSGTFDIFYVDDIPSIVTNGVTLSAHPTTLWVTLDTSDVENVFESTPSYSNSLVSLSSYYYTQSFVPDHLDFTLNGSLPFNNVYWPGVESRFVVSINSPVLSTTSFLSDVPLLNYPITRGLTNLYVQASAYSGVQNNVIFNMSTNPVTGTLSNVGFVRRDSLGRDTGGYSINTFTPYFTGGAVLNGTSSIIYVNDLVPSLSAGYNPTRIPIPSITINDKTINGASSVFNSIDFNSTYFTRKFGGGFDFGAQLQTYALQPTIAQNTNLFKYLTAAAGTSATNDDTYGGVVYEKISNFVSNISDPSTANVNAFYSLAQSLSTALDNYNYGYNIPPGLSRVVDLYSTQQSVVWGANNQDARNFSLSGGLVNLGGILTEYNIRNTTVSAGQLIVANDLFNSQYFELLEVPKITSYASITARGLQNYFAPASSLAFPLTTYPLSGFFGWGLKTPVQYNYRFFVYNSTVNGQQVEGLVNWSDPYTTLSVLSGANHADWVKDEGILENIFNYYIHKGLGLIN